MSRAFLGPREGPFPHLAAGAASSSSVYEETAQEIARRNALELKLKQDAEKEERKKKKRKTFA